MFFESNRLRGRIAILLIVSLPIIMLVTYVPVRFLLNLSASNAFYYSGSFSILTFASYILLLLAMNGFAKYYADSKIFRNVVYSIVTSIIGGAVFAILTYAYLVPMLEQFSAYTATPGTVPPLSILFSVLQAFVVIWIGASVVAVLNGFFLRQAFYALAEKSGEHNFRQAGFFLFIGGLLVIIFIGALLFFIGWIFAVLGFFSMKPKVPPAESTQQVP